MAQNGLVVKVILRTNPYGGRCLFASVNSRAKLSPSQQSIVAAQQVPVCVILASEQPLLELRVANAACCC